MKFAKVASEFCMIFLILFHIAIIYLNSHASIKANSYYAGS